MKRFSLLIILLMLCGSCWNTASDSGDADALTELADVTLLAGDIDDDGLIDITDAVAIGAVFNNSSPPEARLIPDLNIDGVVDILDLILMSANYGQTSEANPWICELPDQL